MRRLTLILALITFLFGIITYDRETYKWGIFACVLYSLPLLSLLLKNKLIQVYTLWFGLFLVLQSTISYFYYQKYHHLTPSMKYQIEVQGDGLPGIQGPQTISTDSLGFRTTKNIDYQKKSDGLRIFTLGASTTESIYLDDHKTWSDQLQQKLAEKTQKPVEVINTGVSGLRMVHIHDNFKKILKFHPDVALFLVGVNDWNRDILNHFDPSTEGNYEVTKLYLRNTLFGLALQTLPVAKKAEKTDETGGTKIEKGEYFTKQNNTLAKADVRKYEPTDILPEYRTYLEKTVRLCKKYNIRCVFLTQPNAYKTGVDEKTKRYFWMTPPNANYTLDLQSMIRVAQVYNTKLKELANQNSIPICDLDAVVPPSIESFYDEVHFNETGSRRVAEKLVECLANTTNTLR